MEQKVLPPLETPGVLARCAMLGESVRLMMCEERESSACVASTSVPCVASSISTVPLHSLEECRKVVHTLSNMNRPLSNEEIECLVSRVTVFIG